MRRSTNCKSLCVMILDGRVRSSPMMMLLVMLDTDKSSQPASGRIIPQYNPCVQCRSSILEQSHRPHCTVSPGLHVPLLKKSSGIHVTDPHIHPSQRKTLHKNHSLPNTLTSNATHELSRCASAISKVSAAKEPRYRFHSSREIPYF